MSRLRPVARWAIVVLLAMVVGLLLTALWLSAAEARPSQESPPPAERCEKSDDGIFWECPRHEDPVLGTGDPPRDWPKPRPDCSESVKQGIPNRFNDGRIEIWVCPVDVTGNRFECRDERTSGFSVAGIPIGWPDHKQWVSFPEYVARQHSWYIDEVRNESADQRQEGTNEDGSPRMVSNLGAKGCELAQHLPLSRCPDPRIANPGPGDAQLQNGKVMVPDKWGNLVVYSPPGLVPDECWGTYPSDFYELSWDGGRNWDISSLGDNLMGWIANFAFGFGKMCIKLALWIVGWVYRFRIGESRGPSGSLITQATDLSKIFRTQFVNHLNLIRMAWFALVAWAAIAALGGRLGEVGGEILMSIVAAAIATVLITHQSLYMNQIETAMDQTSASILQVGVNKSIDDNANLQDQLRPIQRKIHQQFVEQPYYYLQYGAIVKDHCLQITENILATGYTGSGWPKRYLERNGCQELAKYNGQMTFRRFIESLAMAGMAVGVALVLAVTAMSVWFAKFALLGLWIFLPFMAVLGILPGGSRRAAWSLGGITLQLTFIVIFMGMSLSTLVRGMDIMLTFTENVGWFERCMYLGGVVGGVWFLRRFGLDIAKVIGEAFTEGVTRVSPLGQKSRGRAQGIDFKNMESGPLKLGGYAALTVSGVAAHGAIGMALRRARLAYYVGRLPARWQQTLWVERRIARRGYANLRNRDYARWREGFPGWDPTAPKTPPPTPPGPRPTPPPPSPRPTPPPPGPTRRPPPPSVPAASMSSPVARVSPVPPASPGPVPPVSPGSTMRADAAKFVNDDLRTAPPAAHNARADAAHAVQDELRAAPRAAQEARAGAARAGNEELQAAPRAAQDARADAARAGNEELQAAPRAAQDARADAARAVQVVNEDRRAAPGVAQEARADAVNAARDATSAAARAMQEVLAEAARAARAARDRGRRNPAGPH